MKKGFTLIELLAVIVILAIIALIATPIIINIIENARGESEKRSIELYASAVKNAIASYQLTHPNAPTSIDDLTVEYDGDVVCTTTEIYEDGNVYLSDCTVNGSKVEGYTYGKQKEVLAKFSEVCTPVETATTGNVPSGAYEVGDEYTCEVKEGTSYTFFILSKEENKVNLIMDSNINALGEPIKEANPTDKGYVAWLTYEDYVDFGGPDLSNDEGQCEYGGEYCFDTLYGPITAMKYLQEATISWTKAGKLVVNTFEDNAGNTHNMGKVISSTARMPKKSEVINTGCSGSLGSCPLWMENYLDYDGYSIYPDITEVSEVYGYWLLSSGPNDYDAWYLIAGEFNYNPSDIVGYEVSAGIRPVITLEI